MRTILLLVLITYIFASATLCADKGLSVTLDADSLEENDCKDIRVCETDCDGKCNGLKYFTAKVHPTYEMVDKQLYLEECIARKSQKQTDSTPSLNLFKQFAKQFDNSWEPETGKSLFDMVGDLNKRLTTNPTDLNAIGRLVLLFDLFILRNFIKACEQQPEWKLTIREKFDEYLEKTKVDYQKSIDNAFQGKFQDYASKYAKLLDVAQKSPLFQVYKDKLTTFENEYFKLYIDGKLDKDFCRCKDLLIVPAGYNDVNGSYAALQKARLAVVNEGCAKCQQPAQKPVEQKPVEQKPAVVVKPVEQKPVEQKPAVVVKPIEQKPVEQKPSVVVKPVEQKPVEQKPAVVVKPTEQKPAVVKPVEQKPAEQNNSDNTSDSSDENADNNNSNNSSSDNEDYPPSEKEVREIDNSIINLMNDEEFF